MEPNTVQIQQWAGFLFTGGIAGLLAGLLMRGSGFGLLGDVVIGVVGGLLGGWLSSVSGLYAYGSFSGSITALVGAVILVSLTRFLRLAS